MPNDLHEEWRPTLVATPAARLSGGFLISYHLVNSGELVFAWLYITK